jgi:stage II sporulation protein D
VVSLLKVDAEGTRADGAKGASGAERAGANGAKGAERAGANGAQGAERAGANGAGANGANGAARAGLKLLVSVALACLAACGPQAGHVVLPGAVARAKPIVLRVQVKLGNALVVRDVPLEEYVAASALSEVHPDVGDASVAQRIYELQSVIARTYAITNRGRHAKDGFDLCSTTHCQLYEPSRLQTSRWAAAARAGAQHTAGEVLWYLDAPARAVFHADCGGHTSAANEVWGGSVAPAYLSGQRDDGPACSAHSEWTSETRVDALRLALNADPRTAVGAKLDAIEIAGRDGAGRAEQIVLRGSRTFVVRGEVFRDVVTRRFGARALKSTLFSVKKSGGMFSFTGRGFGHGVGLCQAGAVARLKAGSTPEDVLLFYFPGTSVR